MTKKPIVYVDKKTEQYPLWLAEMKYDNTKSLRENYIDNALKPYSQNGTVHTHTHWAFRTLRVLSALINEGGK